MKDWKIVRPIGEFGHQPVIGAFEPSLEDCFPTKTHFGLVQEGTFVYGTLHDAEGNMVTIMRKMKPDFSTSLEIQTTLDGGCLKLHPIKFESYNGPIIQKIKGEQHIAASVPGRGHGFTVERRLDGVTWLEGDFLSLEAVTIGPGVQWYEPDRGGGALYLSHIHHATGTFFGKEVEGFFGWDQAYLPPGISWFNSDHYQRLEVAWFTLGNKYDDGCMEVGQICYGQENFCFALISDKAGPVVMTTDVTADLEFNENGFPGIVHYNIDGEAWDWVAVPNGEMPYYAKATGGLYRPSEGIGKRVGEKRGVACSFGWIDTFSDGRGGFVQQ